MNPACLVRRSAPACARVLLAAFLVHCASAAVSALDVEETLDAMQRELGEGYRFQSVAPYVIASNAPSPLWEQALGTIEGCSAAFYKDFFARRPDYPIRIYLFRDPASYARFTREATGSPPTTPYGYYLPARETLVMNISTGTGTLVHELAHALMRPDFPRVPSWFNEGFASLFEQCQVVGGSLHGLVNWRFPSVRDALDTPAWLGLSDLAELSDEAFYADTKGLHYAEARYFCMFLQERKLLARFYKAFRDAHAKDATGKETIEAVCGKPIDAVEAEWVAWLKTLRYP
ncbi:MAG: hypothetical protein HYZ53_05255 [Planctomycetes bacterium]|nr:hypothetical protein [Planctomycetota bacterium]